MRKNILAGAGLERSAVAPHHSNTLDIDVGALFPGSPLAFDATDSDFGFSPRSCGVRSKSRHGVGDYDFGMFRIETELAGKRARPWFDKDVIGVISSGKFGASIQDALNPAARSARSVG